MVRKAICAALTLVGITTTQMPSALAASFDCAKAGTPFEHAICGDGDLSRADERLAKTYATAIGGLSDQALDEVRASQRDWLDYAQRACTADARPMTSGTYDARGISCLSDLFDSRSLALENSRMTNGIRVYPIANYMALPDPYEADNPASNWPVAQHELDMVQIDGDDVYVADFNAFVRAQGDLLSAGFGEPGGPESLEGDNSSDSSNSITVQEFSGNRISLLVSTYWYGHGAAHGNYTITYRHYLKNEARTLAADDIFTGKGWQKKLFAMVSDAARDEHGEALWPESFGDLADVVTDPARWDLSDPYFLIVQFQPYEISAYAYGAPTARVSWEKLLPILSEDADRYRYGY